MEQYPVVKLILNFRLKFSLSSDRAILHKKTTEIINTTQIVPLFFVDILLAILGSTPSGPFS
jgi:hypothetical protein